MSGPHDYTDRRGRNLCDRCDKWIGHKDHDAARAAAPPVDDHGYELLTYAVPPPDRVAGLREALDECEPVHNAQHQPYGWIVPDWLMLRVRAALLAEPVPLDVERLRCGWCGDDLLLSEIAGHLLSEGRTIPDAARLTDPKGATDGEFVVCGIDGCEFAVERGEGRTMALHKSEDHPDA